jgi:hypothetical protein
MVQSRIFIFYIQLYRANDTVWRTIFWSHSLLRNMYLLDRDGHLTQTRSFPVSLLIGGVMIRFGRACYSTRTLRAGQRRR